MTDATFDHAKHLLTLVSQKETPAEQLKKLFASGLLADLLDANVDEVNRDDFRKLIGLTPLELRIIIDYGMSLEQMVAAGHYDWVNSDITAERFPLKGEGTKELIAQVIHLNRSISSDQVVAELDRIGLRPATIEELLAFGAEFPDMQRKFPIVAFGSSCEVGGSRRVACLGGDGSGRKLYLRWWNGDWYDFSRFLAVAKAA